tara:strand:+ start:984 stop:1385 length:402 start_codon:yes stop_codon:yes gene_type:complete
MKINLCLILVSTLLAMNSNAQDITTESVAILDSIRNTDTKVKILYVTQPKEEPKPKEFYSVQLGAYIAAITSSQFANAENVYHIINEEGIYVYLSGEFEQLNDAIKEKYKLSNSSSNIYVVKVIDNRKIVVIE